MTTLTEFWPTVPSQDYATLRQYAVIFPNAEAASYLTGQDVECDTTRSRTSIREIQGGRFLMCADLLREFHPDTHTGLYDPAYGDVITRYGDQITLEDWATNVADLPPSQPEDEETPQWIQPQPGLGRWFDRGYSFGSRVLHTIDGTEYTMRSNIDWNTVEPVFDARYWQPDPVQAVAWKAGQVWNIGDTVNHPVDDPAYPPPVDTWTSKINANNVEPGHDSGFYRYWEPASPDYEPGLAEYNAQRRYAYGDKCLENGKTYQSVYSGPNSWAPSVYAQGWEEVVTAQGKGQ